MIILCEYCDLRYICYDDWMEHLLSSKHQDVISKAINSWGSPLNERSLVITINGTKPQKTDICWYFASYGLVSDAFFESDLKFCVIQLDKKDYAINAVSTKHCMENAHLSLRLKSDISDAEWIQLNKATKRNTVEDLVSRRKELKESFEERHLKLSTTLATLAIDSQMEIFERDTRMSALEFTLRQNLLKDINRLFNRDYPKCILCPYGSFLTGLGDKSSVLHMYFDVIGLSAITDKCYQGILPPKKEIMESLEKCIGRINKTQVFCHDFMVLPRDATPCIKFTHYVTGITCRFTFESLLPIQTSKLIALVMKLDARLPALFLFVRYWGKYYKISGPQLITSYSLNLLLLVFLSSKKIIPSVAALLSMGNDIKEVNGWETGFCEDKEKIVNLLSFLGVSSSFVTNPTTGKPTAKSILQLAMEFFKMYAHSDLQSQVVCSVIGEFLPKSAFEQGQESSLPKGLEAYKTRISIQKRRLNTKSLLCIQDPFDLVSNVSSSTPEDVIWKFQFLCADTIENIATVVNSPNLNLMDIFNLKANESTKRGNSTTTSMGHSYSLSENRSSNSRSGRYTFVDSPLASPSDNSFNYESSHSRQENSSAYTYQQETRDIPFSYGNQSDQQQPDTTPHHPDMFHHSQHPHDPYSQQSEAFHQQYSHFNSPDVFDPQQYTSSQEQFENNDMFTVPHHLQSYHQQNPGYALLPNPPMPLNPQFPQRFPPLNPVRQPIGPSQKGMFGKSVPDKGYYSSTSTSAATLPKPPPAPTISGTKPTPQAAKRQRKRNVKFPNPRCSLNFGGYEKMFVYLPDEAFQRLFKENFGNLVAEPILDIRLKVLWCMFMKDFFSDVWWKGFSFEVAEVNPSNFPNLAQIQNKVIVKDYLGRSRNSASLAETANKSDEAPDAKKQKLENENAIVEANETKESNEKEASDKKEEPKPITYIYPPNENPHQRKFFEIQIKFSQNNAFTCTIKNSNFIIGRGRIRSNALNDRELLVKFPDPLDWEGHVTKTAASVKKGPLASCDFAAKISLDTSMEDIVSVSIKDVVVDLNSKNTVQNVITHVVSVIRDLVPKYSIYRLKKWLSTEDIQTTGD